MLSQIVQVLSKADVILESPQAYSTEAEFN